MQSGKSVENDLSFSTSYHGIYFDQVHLCKSCEFIHACKSVWMAFPIDL